MQKWIVMITACILLLDLIARMMADITVRGLLMIMGM